MANYICKGVIPRPVVDLDELDSALLRALAENGRASDRELARLTASTAPTVARRIKRLQSIGVLSGVHPTFNIEKFEIVTLVGNGVVACGDIENYLTRLMNIPEVIGVHRLAGNRITFVMRLPRGSDSAAKVAEIERVAEWKSLTVEPTITSKESSDRIPTEALSRLRLTCDYCSLPVHNDAHIVKFQGRIHPCCCPICKRELEARFARLTTLRDR